MAALLQTTTARLGFLATAPSTPSARPRQHFLQLLDLCQEDGPTTALVGRWYATVDDGDLDAASGDVEALAEQLAHMGNVAEHERLDAFGDLRGDEAGGAADGQLGEHPLPIGERRLLQQHLTASLEWMIGAEACPRTCR